MGDPQLRARGWSSRTRVLLALSVALAPMLAGPAPASADYRNPRLLGDPFWVPPSLRGDPSLVSFHPFRSGGHLKGLEGKVREEADVDPERGLVYIRQRMGDAWVAPEWIADFETAAKIEGAAASRKAWRDAVTKSLQAQRGKESDVVSIQIPVDLPDAVARVIGQGARLNLTGSESITFSGTSTILKGGPQFETGNPSLFPALDIKQQLKLNLDGTIGEKIHVLVNHDSEVATSFSNKIQLRYDGNEDDVVQKIEMGNTDLTLPGAEFLSFRKSQQGLFGAKAIAKLGPLDLTAIASKQEGQTATQTFVGQARRDSVVIRDWEYVKRTYYWIAHPVQLAIAPAADGLGILPVKNIEVYLDDKDPRNDIATGARLGFAFVNPATGTPADTVGVVRGTYARLKEDVDYRFDRQTGVLTMERAVDREDVLAITYVRDDSLHVGSVANPDTLRLQLLAPPERDLYDPAKGLGPLQVLEQKNVYAIGARNINPASLEVVVRRKASAAGQRDEDVQKDVNDPSRNLEYIRVLGLDYKGASGPDPDLKIEPEFLDFEDGTITFPNITPFAPDSSVYGGTAVNVIVAPSQVHTGRSTDPIPLLDTNPGLYSLQPDDLINREKYVIEVQFTTPTPSYNLNRFNILEGSETVHLNGRTLSRGVDYDIDYDLGILTFRTPDANAPDAQIEVDFQYVPLFGQAKESLAGISGTYNFSDRTKVSSSWLYFARSTPELRPKLGQEPSRILVGDLYGQWASNPTFLTGLVNKIPLVSSEDESEIQVQGEVAVSLPNPNTKNEIYIDDMEGVADSRDIPLTRGLWVPASEPAGPGATVDHPDLDKATDRVRPLPFNWYNPENAVRRQDVFVELSDERQGQDYLQVMEMRPRLSAPDDSTGWFGVMRCLSTVGEDFSQKKFLEIWVNDFGRNQGHMIFDMGEISEDFYVRSNDNPNLPPKGRGQLDTEDFNPYDGELTVSQEDFGLDDVKGVDGTGKPFDDGDDDFRFNRSDPDSIRYENINNFEGNSLLDTEDLDGDNLLDTDNIYASYVVDLAETAVDEQGFLAQNNYDPATRPNNHWRLYRIPLDKEEPVGGAPRRRSVKYVRLWFDGISGAPGPKVQIASISIKGAAWLEEKQTVNATGSPVDPVDAVGSFVVNTADNKENNYYFPPFFPGEDTNNQVKREQTLVMEYDGIPSAGDITRPGEQGRQGTAYREIVDTGDGKSQDFTQYETMSFYLRDGVFDQGGNPRDRYRNDSRLANGSTGTFFFRFGPDTTNFYEFSTTRLPGQGGDSGWREASVDMIALADLKLEPPQKKVTVEGVQVDYRSKIVDGDTLAVYGAPSLSRIRRLTLGVKGDDPTRSAIVGELWVDEIRLRSVLKDPGYASRVSGSARLADFATVDAGARAVDSEFRTIEGDRHGTNEKSWNVRGDVKLNKFFDNRGLSVPVTAEYTNSRSTPRLAPNSDIVLVQPEDKEAATTTDWHRSLSSRFAKTRPSGNAWLRYTLDNVTVSYTDSKSHEQGPFIRSDNDVSQGQAGFNLNPGQGKTLRLLDRFDLSYFPTLRLGMNGSLNTTRASDIRTDSVGVRVESPRALVRSRLLQGTLGLQWDPLRSNTLDSSFHFDKTQDLDRHEEDPLWSSFRKGGTELTRNHGTRVSWRPSLLSWVRPVMTYDTSYQDDQSPSVQPPDLSSRADSLGGPLRVFRVQNSANRDFSTSVNLRALLGGMGGGSTTKRPPHSGGESSPRKPGAPPENDESPPRDPGERPPPPESAGKGGPGVDGKGTPGDQGAGGKGAPGEQGAGAKGGPGGAKSGAPGEGGADEEAPWSKLGHGAASVLNMLGDIRASYQDHRTSRYSRVRNRPSLGYQLGFESLDLGSIVPVSGTGANLIEDNTDRSWSSKIDSSLQPASGIVLDGAWTRAIARHDVSGSRSANDDVTWPDFSVSLDGLENRRPLSSWVKSSSVNSSYRKQTQLSGRLPALNQPPPPGPWYDTKNVHTEYAPFLSWNAAWKSGINTTISHNRSTDVEQTEFDALRSQTETQSVSWRVSGKYSFSAPQGIRLLGKKLRFRSDLTLNVDIDRSEQTTKELEVRSTGETTSTVRAHTKAMSVKPHATYNFSRKVQGTMDITYSRNYDVRLDRTETIVGLALQALFKF
ncbi:MAG: cell surface protein SprA [bacterium]